MDNKQKIVGVVSITIILTAAMTFMATSALYAVVLKTRSAISFPGSQKMYEALNLLENYYYYDINKEELIDNAIETIMDSLGDPYTTYMDKEEYSRFTEHLTGTYAGIGSAVLWDTEMDAVIIVNPFDDSPAQKAGLVRGDRVTHIDGENLSNTDLDGAVARMKGEKDTSVVLTVLKYETEETVDITVIRDEIHIPSVNSKMDGDIGHISIAMFDKQTDTEFKKHLTSVLDDGARGIVLDLRNNGGGLVETVTSVANNILSKGQMIFYTQNKSGKRVEHKAYGDGLEIPIVVLINENTASASELLAGALRDNRGIKLVGKKSYGKGVVQVAYPLSDGSVAKITVEKYFTPNGVDINTIGLEPDYEVELETTDDEQYQKALEILKSQLQ